MVGNIKNIKQKKFSLAIIDFDDIKNPLLNAGQARSTYEVGSRLAKRGHRVVIISSRYPGYENRREAGMEYRHIGLGSRFLRLNNLCFFPAVIGAVRKLKADIILECFTAPISTLFTPLVTDIPVVAKPTSFEAERFRQLYHLPFDWVEKAGCKFYGYFAAGNISDEEKMRRYNPNIKIKLVAEGVSDEYFQIPRQKPKYILCLGRIDISQKGLDLLLSAYASIRNSVGWKLMIAGHGPDTVKLRALIKSYDMEKEIEIAGPVYGEKKRQILAEAAFVVLPSRREGFCLFALEALAAGLPIVCFDIPGLAWITADAAAKAKPFDAAEFSKKILEFAGNAEHRELAGRQARALAGNYSWDKTAENMENFFLDVLADKNKYEK